MHIPKTIINKLIPFFPKHPSQKILKQAKASLDKSTRKGCLEVASGTSWTRVWTGKLSEEELLSEPTQFLIERENLEDIGYQTTLEEAAFGFDEEDFEEYLAESKLSPSQLEKLKHLAKLADDFPQFENCYQPSNGENRVTVNLLELKKIIDLALAVAEASQINAPTFTFSFKHNSPLYWELNSLCFGESPTYLADGVLMPMKINQTH